MTSMFNPTVGSSATSANRRHSRLPPQADLATARSIGTTWPTTAPKPPSTPSRPKFASASHGKADSDLPSISIAAQGSGRVGPLRGFLPRGLSNACPHASSCTHGLRTRAGIEQRLTGSDRWCLAQTDTPSLGRSGSGKPPKSSTRRSVPWNKGTLTGQKPPLKLPEIWAIRVLRQLV